MMSLMGRMGVAVYYYLYVVNVGGMAGIFMMTPMAIAFVLCPFVPKLIEKVGKKKTLIICNTVHIVGLALIIWGPKSIPAMIIFHIIYGVGAAGLPCPPSMIVEALDAMDLKTGVRTDGTAFALLGLGTKIGQAIGASVGIALLGLFGYAAGAEITSTVATGITLSVNVLPIILLVLAFIPLFIYNLNEADMVEVREKLSARNAERASKSAN